jgi:clan AA aspartic protease (TIGR02281 family)
VRRLYGLILCALVVVCCVAQTVSESRAASDGSKGESWRLVGESVIHDGSAPTKVKVIGNMVLVPATVVYGGNQADIQLLLDTGASVTAIDTEIADRLHMSLRSDRKTRGRVAGGQVIEAYVITLNSLTVGPHTKNDIPITVIPQTGPRMIYDGLLGMDVLRSFKYRVDLDKQLILWE